MAVEKQTETIPGTEKHKIKAAVANYDRNWSRNGNLIQNKIYNFIQLFSLLIPIHIIMIH